MYASQMNLCKPSRTHSTKELIITKNPNEDMAQYVYDIVNGALSSGIDNRAVLTLGVIMMGPRTEVKNFKDMLDEKLTPLENQYGTEAVDRHFIKVTTAEDFQGDQRDIILIGCVSEKVPHETDPDHGQKWNLSVSDFKKGEHDIRSMAEESLVVELDKWGYEACSNEAALWTNALSIGLKDGKISDNCALIAIENYGETLEEWHKIVHEQVGLEEAGITCLRVDALALSLYPEAVFNDVSTFLEDKAGLSPPTNMDSDESDASRNLDAKPPPLSKQRKRPANEIDLGTQLFYVEASDTRKIAFFVTSFADTVVLLPIK
ncbi:hypothetical protein FRACYDRAFT_233053 [Fragilariopsis cylindrus CCMP1102]|uniref:DNA2/NAM7 helicase-like C-terminal domain-containing protein n=1 Tax=Fragilariopsis cylindrus CCMP1102 TaxID=635003 RepID=A0A1E7FXL0_9STRA|nr:hypothetical protein FRACYDRAFT_233053 [Fragilariopsis cylindrus CCMP1102]|eukprot:OEU22889.1 hypothetical protein FRACYDRAFT_233053 [Fragilariopsis cylindrus CCMP1102]